MELANDYTSRAYPAGASSEATMIKRVLSAILRGLKWWFVGPDESDMTDEEKDERWRSMQW